ncbi:hypothetical protein B0H10DRAFT_1940971 [Mycena sp. CBHHK59/15]|nr:hypothetical protein B0H10DRAFT_1940971 [Mycena sp. CBHHK59/15]
MNQINNTQAPYPSGFSPNRPAIVNWPRDHDSHQYSLDHTGSPDLGQFMDDWQVTHANMHEPMMAGVASYNQTLPMYGTSGPKHRNKTTWITAAADIQWNRLNAIDPKYYSNLIGTNTLRQCCKWITLPGQFDMGAGTLRTLKSEARFFHQKKQQAFCWTCRSLAQRAVYLNPGLQIIDVAADNLVYQSSVTEWCFNARKMGVTEDHIQNVGVLLFCSKS